MGNALLSRWHDANTRYKVERVFRRSPDPYHCRDSSYELAKVRDQLAVLGVQRFKRGLEIGCGEGVFTPHLAQRCDQVVGIDLSSTAIARAKETTSHLSNVSVLVANIRRYQPPSPFDLIVASEVLYYVGEKRSLRLLEEVVERIVELSDDGGYVLLVHGISDPVTRASRERYRDFFLRQGMGLVTERLGGDFPHDKGDLRYLISLLRKPH